jgi:hypothetical protein
MEQRFRAGARVTFLCKRPKKSNQKKGRFPVQSSIANLIGAGIFARDILSLPKTAHFLCAALRVCKQIRNPRSLESKALNALAAKNARQMQSPQTRRALPVDGQRFLTEPWMASQEIPGSSGMASVL